MRSIVTTRSGCAALLLAALLLANAVPMEAARPLLPRDSSRTTKGYVKVARLLKSASGLDASGWSNPTIKTGNKVNMENGPTTQEQTAADAIQARVASVNNGLEPSSTTSQLHQDNVRSWLHPQLAHGKKVAFSTGGATRQEQDTVAGIEADAANSAAGAGRMLMGLHNGHHTTHRYGRDTAQDTGATTAAELETVDSVEHQASDIEEAAASNRKLLGPQDWQHPQLAHGKKFSFGSGATRQEQDTIDSIEADVDSIAARDG